MEGKWNQSQVQEVYQGAESDGLGQVLLKSQVGWELDVTSEFSKLTVKSDLEKNSLIPGNLCHPSLLQSEWLKFYILYVLGFHISMHWNKDFVANSIWKLEIELQSCK